MALERTRVLELGGAAIHEPATREGFAKLRSRQAARRPYPASPSLSKFRAFARSRRCARQSPDKITRRPETCSGESR